MDAGVKRMLNTLTADSDFAAEEVRLTKQGGLSDADEIIASKLRDQGIETSNDNPRRVLSAAGFKFSRNYLKSVLVHCTTEMLAQQLKADQDESADGRSGRAPRIGRTLLINLSGHRN